MENVAKVYGSRIYFATTEYEALQGADALIIATEWSEFRTPDFKEIKKRMTKPVIFDGRNLYSIEQMQQEGFSYYSIGRKDLIQ